MARRKVAATPQPNWKATVRGVLLALMMGLTVSIALANSHNVNPLIYQRAGYDSRKDFVPVVELTQGPSVLVTPSDSAIRSLKELVDAARAKPNALSYGSSGVGLPNHIATEMLKADYG